MNGVALLESARVGADALRTNPLRTLLATTGVVIAFVGTAVFRDFLRSEIYPCCG